MYKTRRPNFLLDPTAEETNKDITMEELINRTFHIFNEDTQTVKKSKEAMMEIANHLLQQMQNAIHRDSLANVGKGEFDDKHRQLNRQELIFNPSLGYQPIEAFVPISKIYIVKEPQKKLTKQLTVITDRSKSVTQLNVSKFFIIKELTFQIYAHTISEQYDFFVPQPSNINFYTNEQNNLVCEFEMEIINDKLSPENMLVWFDSISPDKQIAFIKKVQNSFDYLRSHAIFHNDSHIDNVLFTRQSNSKYPSIWIIDFGKAMCYQALGSSSGLFITGLYKDEEIGRVFKLWINAAKEGGLELYNNETRIISKYGGKQYKKNRKTNKKGRKNHRKTNKKGRNKNHRKTNKRFKI